MNSNQQRVNILVNVLNLSSDGAEKHLSEFQDNQEKKNNKLQQQQKYNNNNKNNRNKENINIINRNK